jgi:hypothetical protein
MTCREGLAGRLPGSLATIAAMVALLAPCLLVAACSRTAAATAESRESSLSGPSGAVDLKPTPPEDCGPGLKLLREAAEAGSTVSYQGVEMVSTWAVTGDSTMIADVWHRSGGSTLVQAALAGAVSPARQAGISDDTDSQAPEGVLGVTAQLVSLLVQPEPARPEGRGLA